MVSDQVQGLLGALIAIVCFGSNYVFIKGRPVGDGIIVQWAMANGILLTGLVATIASGTFVFELSGLLGGALWACGNAMVPLIIRYIGLGLGLLLWSGSNLIMGWAAGRFGFFGIPIKPLDLPVLNYIGAATGLVSLVVYFFIKPTVSDETLTVEGGSEFARIGTNVEQDLIRQSITQDQSIQAGYSLKNAEDAARHRRLMGIGMAMLAGGVFYGFCMIPFQLWYETKGQAQGVPPVAFAFCHFTGIWLLSTLLMVVYIALRRNQPTVYSSTLLPGFVSGAVWGIAQASWFVTNAHLNMDVGYPLVTIGPCIVSSMWSIFYYKEIQGKHNLSVLAAGMLLNVACIVLTLLSKIGTSGL